MSAAIKGGLYQLDLSKLATHIKPKFQALVSSLNDILFSMCNFGYVESCNNACLENYQNLVCSTNVNNSITSDENV